MRPYWINLSTTTRGKVNYICKGRKSENGPKKKKKKKTKSSTSGKGDKEKEKTRRLLHCGIERKSLYSVVRKEQIGSGDIRLLKAQEERKMVNGRENVHQQGSFLCSGGEQGGAKKNLRKTLTAHWGGGEGKEKQYAEQAWRRRGGKTHE